MASAILTHLNIGYWSFWRFQIVSKEESYWVCPNCEALVPDDLDSCPECGYSEAIDDLEVRG